VNVFQYLRVEIRVVQVAEDFIDHRTLVACVELADLLRHDQPVGVDLRAQSVIERKADGLLLLLAEAAVQGGDQSLGLACLLARGSISGGSGECGGGG
jgi:hypothetical protein